MSTLLVNANSLSIPLADESVHCVVTSPPYWGLRSYGIGLDLSYAYLHDQARARLELDKLDAWSNGIQDNSDMTGLPLFGM